MKKPEGTSEARERILDMAEHLFGVKGYAAVTLRDIGGALGLTHASLYYHFPGGKDQLFEEVTERSIRRHGAGLAEALKTGGPHLRGKLVASADWLLSRPPMDLLRMIETDLAAMPPEASMRLSGLIYELILYRLQSAFDEAAARGEIDTAETGLLAGSLVAIVESLFSIPDRVLTRTRREMAIAMIDVILRGIDYSEGENDERAGTQ